MPTTVKVMVLVRLMRSVWSRPRAVFLVFVTDQLTVYLNAWVELMLCWCTLQYSTVQYCGCIATLWPHDLSVCRCRSDNVVYCTTDSTSFTFSRWWTCHSVVYRTVLLNSGPTTCIYQTPHNDSVSLLYWVVLVISVMLLYVHYRQFKPVALCILLFHPVQWVQWYHTTAELIFSLRLSK